MTTEPVLVGCEQSQILTQAFRRQGVQAYSCDLQPTDGDPSLHMQIDVMKVIPTRYWALIVLHPECTAMAVAGNRTYAAGKPDHRKRLDAIEWTIKLWELAKRHSGKVILENPGSVIFPHLRKAGANVQYIQPWQFGHTETKKTGLALHGVDPIQATNDVSAEMDELELKDKHKVWYMSPGPERTRLRSKTYTGIADAIAMQTVRTL